MANATSTGGSLNTLTLTTIQNYLPKMADNITNGSGLFRYAKRKGLLVTERLVGREEVVTIDREDNDNGQWFDDADKFSLAPASGLVDSYVGHHNYRSGFYISDTEEMENMGMPRIRSLMKVRMTACERAMKVDLATALVGTAGSGTLEPEGLRDCLGGATPASSVSTHQRLSAAANTWWAPVVKVATALGPSNSGMREQLLDIFLTLQTNQASPKVGICDQKYYQEFLMQVGGGREVAGYGIPNVRQFKEAPSGTLDTGGPPSIAFWGTEIIYDPYVRIPTAYTHGTDAHINLIDTDFFEIVVDPRWNFKLYRPRERAGGDEQWVNHYSLVFRCTQRDYKRNAHALGVFDL